MKSLSFEKMAKLEGGDCKGALAFLAAAKVLNSVVMYTIALLMVAINCKGIDTTT